MDIHHGKKVGNQSYFNDDTHRSFLFSQSSPRVTCPLHPSIHSLFLSSMPLLTHFYSHTRRHHQPSGHSLCFITSDGKDSMKMYSLGRLLRSDKVRGHNWWAPFRTYDQWNSEDIRKCMLLVQSCNRFLCSYMVCDLYRSSNLLKNQAGWESVLIELNDYLTLIAVNTSPAFLTNTLSRFVAITMDTFRIYTLAAIWTFPSKYTLAFIWTCTGTMFTSWQTFSWKEIFNITLGVYLIIQHFNGTKHGKKYFCGWFKWILVNFLVRVNAWIVQGVVSERRMVRKMVTDEVSWKGSEFRDEKKWIGDEEDLQDDDKSRKSC